VFHHVATTPWLHFSLCAVGQWLTTVQRLLRSSPVSFDYGAHCVCRLCVAQSACACWFVAYCKFEFRFRIGGMLSGFDDADSLGEKKVGEAFHPLFTKCKWNDCQYVVSDPAYSSAEMSRDPTLRFSELLEAPVCMQMKSRPFFRNRSASQIKARPGLAWRGRLRKRASLVAWVMRHSITKWC
jgi:hypothetical protein